MSSLIKIIIVRSMEIPISKEEVEKEGERETLEMVPEQLRKALSYV
jgi:hypothetical protein